MRQEAERRSIDGNVADGDDDGEEEEGRRRWTPKMLRPLCAMLVLTLERFSSGEADAGPAFVSDM